MAKNIKHSGAVTVNVGAGQQQQQQDQQQQGQPGGQDEPIYGPVTIDQSIRYHRWPWWGILIAIVLLATAIFLASFFAYRAGRDKTRTDSDKVTIILEDPPVKKKGGATAVDPEARRMAKDAQEGVEKNREDILDLKLEQHKTQFFLEQQAAQAAEQKNKNCGIDFLREVIEL